MCLYLSKRGSTYYFRRLIPLELRPAFEGAGEFMFSLRTKDKAEAKRLRSSAALRTDADLDAARARLSPASAPAVAPPAFTGLTEAAIEQMEWERREDGEREARRESREAIRASLEARLKLSTAQITPEEAAVRDILRDQEHEFTIREERQTARRAHRAEERRGATGAPPSSIALPALEEAPEGSGAAPAAATGAPMLDHVVVDKWAAERKVGQKGIDTHRAVARWFYERVGRKAVAEITRKDVQAFKAKLINDGQTPANIKMKLSRLRTLLQWAADNDYASSNAATGVTIKDTDAAKNKRKEFDLASLNAIFSSPVFSAGVRPAGGKGEAAYWLPLLALYTAGRREELGQLRPSDVAEEEYTDADDGKQVAWVIRLTEEGEGDLTLKNAGSERTIPVHPELERLGFIRFVQEAKRTRQARLFPGLKPGAYGRLTGKWGDWFSRYMRGVCGVTERRLVFHSLRHSFKHYARHVGMEEGVQRQIMGHSSSDAADAYGSGYTLHQLVQGMKLYRVPGLNLPS